MKRKIIVFGAVYLVIAPGIILAMLALEEKTLSEQLLVFVSGSIVLLIAIIIVKILKFLFHKHRPPKKIEFFKPLDRYAFPSGHSTGLAAITFFIFEHSILLGLVSICVGLLIMSARVQAHVHDYIDIIGGIILGMSVAFFLTPTVEAFVSTYLLTHIFL